MDNKSKYPPIYWEEFSPTIINKYSLKETKKGEFHGPCLLCGGKDRFWIYKKNNGELGVNCRQCGDFKGIFEEMRVDGALPTLQEYERAGYKYEPTKDFKAVEPYHIRKGIELYKAKQIGSDIVVPIVDIKGKIVNQQTITPDGKKKFQTGAPVEGNFSVIGNQLEGLCYLSEGYATAASVYQSTKRPSVFCLNSGNLPKVAKLLQEARPECKFVVAADADDAGIKAAKETGLPYRVPREKGWDWNDVMLKHGTLAVQKELKRVKLPKPLFVPLGELDFKAPEWLIDGMLEANTFSVCFGSPAAGKTFLVLDMALCVATGQAFHDKFVKQGTVFYIAGEGHNGFARRAAAWKKNKGVSLDGVPFFKSSRSIIITEEESVNELIDTIDGMVEQFGEPELIVIDTLARSLGAADENSTQAMGAAIRAIDSVKDAYDCTVLAVHHTGHGNKDRSRGSSALLGAVDSEFKVEKWSEEAPVKIEVKFTKMKDAMIPEPMNFAHAQMDLVGSDGSETTSVALLKIDDSRPSKKSNDVDRKEQVLEAFKSFDEERVSRADLKRDCAEKYGESERTFNNVIQEMIGEIFLNEKVSRTNYLTLLGKD